MKEVAAAARACGLEDFPYVAFPPIALPAARSAAPAAARTVEPLARSEPEPEQASARRGRPHPARTVFARLCEIEAMAAPVTGRTGPGSALCSRGTIPADPAVRK
jgi:hypothetical protein